MKKIKWITVNCLIYGITAVAVITVFAGALVLSFILTKLSYNWIAG